MKTLQKWIGILIVLAVGASLYYYFVNKNADVRPNEEVATTTDDVVAAPGNGWKTYTNDGFGFSFEYPSSIAAPEEVTSTRQGSYVKLDLVPWPLFVSVFSVPEYKVKDEYLYNELFSLNADFDGYQVKTMGEPDPDCYGDGCSFRYIWGKVRIDGAPALERISCGGGDVCSRSVYVLSSSSVFLISSNGNYFEQNCDGSLCVDAQPLRKVETTTDFDRVLSSFKFIK